MNLRMLASLLLAAPLSAFAAAPAPAARGEIDHLFEYVAHAAECRFERNGSWHDMGEARSHLAMKYEFLASRGKADTAEDFIENAATRSSITGKNYLVECRGGPAIPSAEWLRAELARYRRKPG
jgi:hypothetical protein